MIFINRFLLMTLTTFVCRLGHCQINQMLKGEIAHGETKSDSIYLKQDIFIPSRYYEPVVK